MSTALVRILVITSVIFTMATGTFASALTSLPDSPLYDAKLAIEQVSLNLMEDPAKLALKHMALAHNRVKEMAQVSQQGDIPDGGTLERLHLHLAYALHYAAQVQGDGMEPVLVQAQNMAQNQIQTLAQVQAQTGGNPEGPVGMALQLMNQFMFQLQFGFGDPLGFRYQHQNGPDMSSLDADQPAAPPAAEDHGQNGAMVGPGERYGNPDCDSCEPVGDAHKWGQDTFSSAGLDCQDCVPAGSQDGEGNQNRNSYQYGQEGGTNGSGEPGGPNPDCPNCDCPNCDCKNPDCPNCSSDGEESGGGAQEGNGPREPNPDCPNCDCPDCPDCPNCDCSDCPNCDCSDCDQNQNGKN